MKRYTSASIAVKSTITEPHARALDALAHTLVQSVQHAQDAGLSGEPFIDPLSRVLLDAARLLDRAAIILPAEHAA
jgi:hypothetical protein